MQLPAAVRIVTDNFGWKLLALLLSFLLWLAIVGDAEIGAGITVPVQFKNIPEDLEISSELPSQVQLEVRGPSRKLRSSELRDTVCVLDLSTVRESGDRTFNVNPTNVNLPGGVVLIRSLPTQLRVRFEERLGREVPVQLRLAGPPPDGFRVARSEIHPDKVRIAGPRSRVEQVDAVQTDPINLTGAGADTEFRVHLFTANPQVRLDTSSTVTVRVILEKITGGAH